MKICSVCGRCFDDSVSSCVHETHPPLSERRDGCAEMISGYRLESLVKSNAKSNFYRARQIESDRRCLVKVFFADDEKTETFLKEAKITSSFFHPSVADVYETGRLDSGELFVVSEDTEGQTVSELLQTVGVPQLLTTVQIVRQAAEALHELHQNGLVHRAVRPENIILTADLEHRLLVRVQNPDLGGVDEHSIVSDKFTIDSAVDSLKYFAPEQFCGEETNAQTDVYALGVVFYELLAGTPPFESLKAAELAEKHKHQPPPDIKIDDFELRMLITHALMESLQKRPSLRQSSANTFARQLRHIEQLATHSPTPPPVVSVPQDQPAKNGLYNPVAAAHSTAAAARTVDPTPVRSARIEMPLEILHEADEPGSVAELENVSPVVPVQHAVERTVTRPVRSRLKAVKRRLHSKTAPQAVKAARNDLAQPVELVVSRIAEVSSEPEELLFIRPIRESYVAAPDIAPKKLEWIQPENDMPSAEIYVAADVTALVGEPKKFDRESVENDFRSKAGVIELLPAEETEQAASLVDEREEITLVTAPQTRFEVEWERPYAWRDIYSDDGISSKNSKVVGYFPTILGNYENVSAFDSDQKGTMFSAYYGHPRRLSARSRVFMIAGGALALMVVFLFGTDVLSRYVETASSGDEPKPTENGPQISQPQRQRLESVVASEKSGPRKTDDARALQPTPSSVTRREPRVPDKQPAVINEKVSIKNQKPKAEPDGKRAGSVPAVRTTLVISSDSGKVNSKLEPAKRSANTRPRIVPNPKP